MLKLDDEYFHFESRRVQNGTSESTSILQRNIAIRKEKAQFRSQVFSLGFSLSCAGGGSIRIHNSHMQYKVLNDILKLPESRIETFSHLLNVSDSVSNKFFRRFEIWEVILPIQKTPLVSKLDQVSTGHLVNSRIHFNWVDFRRQEKEFLCRHSKY